MELREMEKESAAYNRFPIVIPAYQPDEKLITLIGRLKQNNVSNIIIVDDGSGEQYQNIFRTAQETYGCCVIRHAENMGKGRALKSAFNLILCEQTDAAGCVTMDCRGSFPVEDILAVMNELVAHPADLILGKRILDATSMPGKSRIGNKVLQLSFHYLVGIMVTDAQSGLRGIPAAYMKKLMNVRGERYEFDTNVLINCKKYSVSVREVDLKTRYSSRRNLTHWRTLKDNLPIYLSFAAYIYTSLVASIVDLILFTVFCNIYDGVSVLEKTQLYVALATATARVFSATVNYRLNYRIVFRTRSSQTTSFARWIVLCIVQMAMSATAVSLLHWLIGGPEVLFKIPVDFCLFFFSYYFCREFVYK